MSLSPELARLPGIINTFNKSGLTLELIVSMINGDQDRDLVEDGRRILKELKAEEKVEIIGMENIPTEGGALIVFNHPNMDVLLPSMLTLMIEMEEKSGQRVVLCMGSEITMTSKNFNEKRALPGSVPLLKRFHRLYPENIISVPTAQNRKDFNTGRMKAARSAIRAFSKHSLVLISPEGHVEKNNTISPDETLHTGSGRLGMLATRVGVPTIPVAIWEAEKIKLVIGEPFWVTENDETIAVTHMMDRIAELMPEELRG